MQRKKRTDTLLLKGPGAFRKAFIAVTVLFAILLVLVTACAFLRPMIYSTMLAGD